MRYLLFLSIALCLVISPACRAEPVKLVLQAEDAILDPSRVEEVAQQSLQGKKGVSLKQGLASNVDLSGPPPDLVFKVRPGVGGRFVIHTHSAVDNIGRELMSKAKSKHESLFLKIAVGQSTPTKRVVFVPWSKPDSCIQDLGKFDLVAEEQEIRMWLPGGVQLDYLQVASYLPPAVPVPVSQYQPSITPPSTHPRLWVSADTLPGVRANLTRGENAAMWKKVQEAAAQPYDFSTTPGVAVEHDSKLETAAVNKAFVYLMTGNEAAGRQAVALVRDYLATVEFNNLLDITREIGRAIYAGARVYDWCYDLMSEVDRTAIRVGMMRLADDMEIGWPPFKQGVVNGHGSEAQLHCHLLSMAIAVYDEDPVPYQYCAYRILEELVPMRNFEYQSPRHNQGIGYGIYRFAWDMHAAWLLYRMSGKKVFDASIEDVHKYWLYMRVPGGHSLPDGDGNVDGRQINLGITSLLTSAYTRDPIMKWDFVQQGGFPHDPILVLLLNDPDLKPAEDLSSLPLTLDFGPVLGGMVARTGWNMDRSSPDVVAFMTGGGYHFANHQHADAGSFQIYYRGMQVVDLGQYMFYGTPYDNGFNKRSAAHSMMLAYDPKEKITGNRLNDGGARFVSPSPKSPDVVLKNPMYQNGKVISAAFGPSPHKPAYSYFSVDLTSAYSSKIRNYRRSFCFLNLENTNTPAALLVLDNMETSGPEIKKYWQVNTLNPPAESNDGLILSSSDAGSTGKVVLQMLRPAAGDRTMQILTGPETTNVFGTQLIPPKPDAPQAHGHRIMFSPARPQKHDTFLTVLTMMEGEQTTMPVNVVEGNDVYVATILDRTVVLSKSGELITGPFNIDVPGKGESHLVLTGMKPGRWNIHSNDGNIERQVQINARNHSNYLVLSPGTYAITPRSDGGSPIAVKY